MRGFPLAASSWGGNWWVRDTSVTYLLQKTFIGMWYLHLFFPGVNWGVRHLLTTHLLIHTFGWCFPCCGLFSGCKLGDERERYQGPQPAYKSRTNPTQIGKFVRFVLGSPQRQITRSVFHWSADVRHCTPIYSPPIPCEVRCVKTLVIKFSSMI